MAEEALRQTLTISRGSFWIFIERPASIWIITLTAIVLFLVPLMKALGREPERIAPVEED